jgi:Carboxypeptidase regulatory-like domain/TonB dependent receptor
MKSKLLAGVFVFLVCLVFLNPAAYGQGVGTSGSISGTVTDPQGGVLPKASIVALETAQGSQYSAITDDTGQYRLTGLLPGSYRVTTHIDRFETEAMTGVVVNIGETVILDFHLKLATTSQTVEVTAIPPVVETERGSQANTITQRYIEDLPIDRRDYLTFTLLLPGVSDSTRLADDQDFRVKQTPQSGLSFYGSNGRGNSITVDGGEAQDDAGGVRPTVGQDAVQEFQVNRSNYAADLGGANGASINIVSKSGTNDIHGSLFGYFRNDALDARDPFAFNSALAPGAVFDPTNPIDSVGAPVKDSLQRYQFGGSIGAPIRKDKTFFFASFEGLRQDAQNAVPLLTSTSILRPTFAQQTQILDPLAANPSPVPIPCLSGPVGAQVSANLPPPFIPGTTSFAPAVCAQVLAGALTVNNVNPALTPIGAFLVNQFESQGGLFDYNSRDYLASARLDHHIDANNQLFLSYRYGHDLEQNPDVQSLTAFSAGSSTHDYDNNIQGAWFHQFSPTTQNELRVQWDYNSFNVIPNEPGQVGIQIPGFINNLGTNVFLPNLTILRRTEIADNVTMIRGHHTIQFGGNELLRGNHTESHTFFPGRFVFGTLPDGGNLLSPLLPTLSPLQSASFGLPVIYQQGFGDADYPAYTRPLTGLYLQDSWKITSNFTLNYGLRYEIDSEYLPVNTYYKDFAPRVSFAWDPFKDHKTVVRGGYGIFYGPIDAQIPGVDLSLGALNKNRSTVENQHNKSQVPDQVNNLVNTCGIAFLGSPFSGTGNSPCTRFISIAADTINSTGLSTTGGVPIQTTPVVFGTLFAEGLIQCTTPAPGSSACITPADVAPLGIIAANSGQLSPLAAVFSNPPNYRPPQSQQASLGIEREISPGFSIGVSGIYSHTLYLPVAIDTNLLPTTAAGASIMSTVTLANGKSFSYRNWNGGTPGHPAGADPLGGGEFPGGLSPCAPIPPDPFSSCFVNQLISQNNQYTSASSSLYEGLILEMKKRFSNHFTLFGNYTFSKGFDTTTDFNSDYGPQDPTDLALERGLSEFDERHKVVVAGVFDSPWKGFLSGFQLSPIFTYHSGLPFNLLAGTEVNGDNHTTNERPIGAPRDTGLGPNFVDFDMRLSWRHKLGERATMILTAEGFNIANHTNFASVNNEVSPLFGIPTAPGAACPGCPGGLGNTTFNVHGIRPGTTLPDGEVATPSTPLAFTSAFPKRQVQLGIRFAF